MLKQREQLVQIKAAGSVKKLQSKNEKTVGKKKKKQTRTNKRWKAGHLEEVRDQWKKLETEHKISALETIVTMGKGRKKFSQKERYK